MAKILWVIHSESSEEIEQWISSYHLSRIDWCVSFFIRICDSICACGYCVYSVLLHTQQCFRSFVRLLFHWALFDLFCFFTHAHTFDTCLNKTYVHKYMRTVAPMYTNDCQIYFTRTLGASSILNFTLNDVVRDFFNRFFEIIASYWILETVFD